MANKSKQFEWTAKYASKSPAVFMKYLILKRKEEKQDIPIDYLMDLWESQKGLCALSGVPMTHIRGQGNVGTNISIDKIDPNKGYLKGNIQLVCRVINHMKWTSNLSELTWWCSRILEVNFGNRD